MSDLTEYKCPECAGAMVFDASTQKLSCPYCGNAVDADAFSSVDEKIDEQAVLHEENSWSEDEIGDMVVHVCQSCGGEIVTTQTSASSVCPYCGNKVFIQGQFVGGSKPDFVVPFKHTKEEAKSAYYKHIEGKPFLPKLFKSENHIDDIVGCYVPFWLFDAQVSASASYLGSNVRTWRSGDIQYTETSDYSVFRSGNMAFEKIPVDGSKSMDDELMESIEPFDFSEAVPFTTGYLAGFGADRYDVSKEDSIGRAENRIRTSADQVLYNTVDTYDKVMPQGCQCSIANASYVYGLYPVWVLNTTYNDEKYTFAMNGQTGKMVGNLPFDRKAFYTFTGAISVATAVLLYAAEYLIFMF